MHHTADIASFHIMHQADFIFIAPIPILYPVFAAQVYWLGEAK